MVTEPIWTLKELASHHNMTVQSIVGWSSQYPLPPQFTPEKRAYAMTYARKSYTGKYKRSELLAWFKQAQAAINLKKVKS